MRVATYSLEVVKKEAEIENIRMILYSLKAEKCWKKNWKIQIFKPWRKFNKNSSFIANLFGNPKTEFFTVHSVVQTMNHKH